MKSADAFVLGVLVSGSGTNLQAVIDAIASGRLHAKIGVVVSNIATAKGLDRARAAGIPTAVLDHKAYPSREAFDGAVVEILRSHGATCVVLAGFMRLITPVLLDAFPQRVVNIHPSLLPAFPGVHSQAQALAYGVRVSGCTVHLVDAGMDTGPILAQAAVSVLDGDDEATLRDRILVQEHDLLPTVLQWMAEGRVEVVPGTAGARPHVRIFRSSMSSKHYDVVVLGGGVGALTAAALLARRSWRVLVLGHGWRRPTYSYDGLVLARRPFTFLSASSPAWGRVLVELAQSQTFRRRLASLDPMLQVLAPDARLDLPPDTQLFAREIDREFPAVRRVVDDLYAELARTNAAADAAFERDAVWPPGGFWERRETERVIATLPYLDGGSDFLAEFPRDHAFRGVVTTPARFACDLADDVPAFALARLHGAWTRGVNHLAGGEDELVDFLLERVRAHGGDTRLADRASGLVHKGGKVRGVHIDGDETPVGVTFVVSDLPTAPVLDLARDFISPRNEKTPSLAVGENRFVVSLVVRPEGVPRPLATESFMLPAKGTVIHVQKAPGASPGTVLLVAEAILPEGASLARAREDVLATIAAFLPFVERHALVCDSPHDGRPLWDFRNATPADATVGPPSLGLRAQSVDRARLRASGGSLEPEPMVARFNVTPPQLHGLAGEPIRTALGNVFVTGRSTLPALGQEGELLAAWGVARVITRTDRRKEKMLREMWSKVELS